MGIWSFSLLLLGMLRAGGWGEVGGRMRKTALTQRKVIENISGRLMMMGQQDYQKSQEQWATNSAFTVIWLLNVRIHGNPNMFKK